MKALIQDFIEFQKNRRTGQTTALLSLIKNNPNSVLVVASYSIKRYFFENFHIASNQILVLSDAHMELKLRGENNIQIFLDNSCYMAIYEEISMLKFEKDKLEDKLRRIKEVLE